MYDSASGGAGREDAVARKKTATKKSARKGKKVSKKVAGRAPKKAARRPTKRAAARKVSARRTAKKAPTGRKRAARPAASEPAAPVRKGFAALGEKEAPVRVAQRGGIAAAGSTSGEVYGEEGWREEELSAAELDAETPELDELEPGMGAGDLGETDEDAEW